MSWKKCSGQVIMKRPGDYEVHTSEFWRNSSEIWKKAQNLAKKQVLTCSDEALFPSFPMMLLLHTNPSSFSCIFPQIITHANHNGIWCIIGGSWILANGSKAGTSSWTARRPAISICTECSGFISSNSPSANSWSDISEKLSSLSVAKLESYDLSDAESKKAVFVPLNVPVLVQLLSHPY